MSLIPGNIIISIRERLMNKMLPTNLMWDGELQVHPIWPIYYKLPNELKFWSCELQNVIDASLAKGLSMGICLVEIITVVSM